MESDIAHFCQAPYRLSQENLQVKVDSEIVQIHCCALALVICNREPQHFSVCQIRKSHDPIGETCLDQTSSHDGTFAYHIYVKSQVIQLQLNTKVSSQSVEAIKTTFRVYSNVHFIYAVFRKKTLKLESSRTTKSKALYKVMQ